MLKLTPSRRSTAPAVLFTMLALVLGPPSMSAERAGAESGPARAARTLAADPSNYLAQLRALRAGDRLVLKPGTYRGGLPVHRIHGTAEAPVTIEGPSAERGAVFVARRGRNTVSIVDSAHVVIRNLRLDGLDLPVDAVKAEGHAAWAHHITLEGLRIINHGYSQQTVGISTKCPAWGWVVRGNSIVGAGTGMYFGDSDGTKPFFASLIEANLIVNPRGYALQIKHQHDRPDIRGAPGAPAYTVIRRNRFIKREGAAAREFARPNVLVGHFPLAGRGAEDFYVIYANAFEDNPTEALFQGEGNIAFYNNLLVNPHGDALRIQPHNHLPRSILMFHNTVLASGAAIAVRGGEAGYFRYVGQNALFAKEGFAGEAAGENFVARFEQADAYLVAPFAAHSAQNLGPRGNALVARSPLPAEASRFPEAGKDYRGMSRLIGFHGACQADAAATGPAPCR